jgi:predicted GIY-YIG superfamily endonuclease
MHYVYLIRSIPNPDQTYVGHTKDLKTRLLTHNNGQSPHTSKYKPWNLVTYLAFSDKAKALSFEKYLKLMNVNYNSRPTTIKIPEIKN